MAKQVSFDFITAALYAAAALAGGLLAADGSAGGGRAGRSGGGADDVAWVSSLVSSTAVRKGGVILWAGERLGGQMRLMASDLVARFFLCPRSPRKPTGSNMPTPLSAAVPFYVYALVSCVA